MLKNRLAPWGWRAFLGNSEPATEDRCLSRPSRIHVLHFLLLHPVSESATQMRQTLSGLSSGSSISQTGAPTPEFRPKPIIWHPPPNNGTKIVLISCSFWENLANLYVVPPPPTRNPESAPD